MTVVLLALAGSLALAQDNSIPIADATSQAMPLAAPRSIAASTAPTLKQNFRYAFNRVFSPGKQLLLAVEAAMDREQEIARMWRQGMQGFGSRYADVFGRSRVREDTALGVGLVLAQDRRVSRAVSQASGSAREAQ